MLVWNGSRGHGLAALYNRCQTAPARTNLAMAGLSLWFIFLLAISVLAPWWYFSSVMASACRACRMERETVSVRIRRQCDFIEPRLRGCAHFVVVPMLHKIFTAFDLRFSRVDQASCSHCWPLLCVHQLTPSVSKPAWLLPRGYMRFSAVLLFGAMTFSPFHFYRQHPRPLDSLMYVSNADSGTQVLGKL